MNIRTQLITAGAIFALAIPAVASASPAKTPSFHAKKPTVTLHTSGHKTAPNVILPAKVTPPVVFIHVSGPAQPTVESQEQLCQTQGTGCTAEQYCDFWSIACADVANSDSSTGSTAATAPAVDPAELLSELENEYCCDPLSCMSLV